MSECENKNVFRAIKHYENDITDFALPPLWEAQKYYDIDKTDDFVKSKLSSFFWNRDKDGNILD